MTAPLTAGETLATQARLFPDRIGARDLERAITFLEWNDRACRLANALLELGLAAGDRVAVLAHNRLEWAEIYVAAAKAGLVAVPINFRLVAAEIAYILRDCAAAAIIVEDRLADRVASLADTHRILLGPDPADAGFHSYEALLAAASPGEPGPPVAADAPWCLIYTSGTTGRPKGAIRCHRDMAMLALVTAVEFGLSRADHALLVMPMCHANSLYFFNAFLALGAPVTIFSRAGFDPALCLATLGAGAITFTSLVPTHYAMMLDLPDRVRVGAGAARVRGLVISSAPAHAPLKRAIMAMFPACGLYEMYGSTEAGWVTILRPDEQFDRLGTVGREIAGSAPVRILDEAGVEVPDGSPGELHSRAPYAFAGYWNLPDKTAEAFRGDWLSVGDIALRDADGFVRLIDRKKNTIISGGENIYPAEVEAVLATHPAIADVAVIGLPDPRWGERVTAVVVARAGASVSEAALLDWARPLLAGHKRPRGVQFLAADEMPRNASGKILHRALRERFASS